MNKILIIIGRALFPALAILMTIFEVVRETEWVDKMDDLAYLGIAVLALLWAILFRKKTPQYFPVIFLILALEVKIYSLFAEGDDKKAIDPDYFVIAFIALSALTNGIAGAVMHKRKQISQEIESH